MGSNEGAHSNVCPYGYVKTKFDTSPYICYYFLVGVADMLTLISCLDLLSSFFKTRQPATQPFLMGNLRDKPIHFEDLLSSKPTSLPLEPFLRETWGSSYLIILHYGKHLFSVVLASWPILPFRSSLKGTPKTKDLFLYFFIFLLVISYICWIFIGYKTSIWSCI